MIEKIKKFIKEKPLIEKYVRIFLGSKKITETFPKKKVKGINNKINIDKSATLYSCNFDIVGDNNTIEIYESAILNNVTFFIRGNNNLIKIGGKVTFNRAGVIWIEDNNCKAIIGENTTFEDSHIAVTEPYSEIVIGEDCMFAYDIDLRTGDSHSIVNSQTNERINYAKNINIGNHVWVASHVTILKGVHLSDNSVVATRAVVTKSFLENNILIGGMPARKIKENINWDRKRF